MLLCVDVPPRKRVARNYSGINTRPRVVKSRPVGDAKSSWNYRTIDTCSGERFKCFNSVIVKVIGLRHPSNQSRICRRRAREQKNKTLETIFVFFFVPPAYPPGTLAHTHTHVHTRTV